MHLARQKTNLAAEHGGSNNAEVIENGSKDMGVDNSDDANGESPLPPKPEATYAMKVGSALFYSGASLAVIFINKGIMTGYHFPFVGFMATVQFLGTVIVLALCSFAKKIELPPLTWDVVRDISPVSIMFLGNILTGLGGTKNLNLPMFTCLRRFSILFVMLTEWAILGSRPPSTTQLSVALMLGGSIIAAMYDLQYDKEGYMLVMANNLFTALNGVWMKKTMFATSMKNNKLGVLFYNSLFSAIAMVAMYLAEDFLAWRHNSNLGLYGGGAESGFAELEGSEQQQHGGDLSEQEWRSTLTQIRDFGDWGREWFFVMFIAASLLGSVLNYSIFLCTAYNSALTTAVIGCLKNVVTAYVGMLIFSDFDFNMLNFAGINLSIVGSIYYTYCELCKKNKTKS